MMNQPITGEQILAVLQQRALTDRLISEILRAAAIEASVIANIEEEEEPVTLAAVDPE